MKIVTKTILIVDRDKPQIPANTEVDLPKKIAENLLSRGLVDLPVSKSKAAKKAAKPGSGADTSDDSQDEDAGNDAGNDSLDEGSVDEDEPDPIGDEQ